MGQVVRVRGLCHAEKSAIRQLGGLERQPGRRQASNF